MLHQSLFIQLDVDKFIDFEFVSKIAQLIK